MQSYRKYFIKQNTWQKSQVLLLIYKLIIPSQTVIGNIPRISCNQMLMMMELPELLAFPQLE